MVSPFLGCAGGSRLFTGSGLQGGPAARVLGVWLQPVGRHRRWSLRPGTHHRGALSPGTVPVWTRSTFVVQAAAAEAACHPLGGHTRVLWQGAAAAGGAVSPGWKTTAALHLTEHLSTYLGWHLHGTYTLSHTWHRRSSASTPGRPGQTDRERDRQAGPPSRL